MKTKITPIACAARHYFAGAILSGAALLPASSAQAQTVFVSEWSINQIIEFTPGGGESTFASDLGNGTGGRRCCRLPEETRFGS